MGAIHSVPSPSPANSDGFLPRAAPPENTPWDDLASRLSDPTTLIEPSFNSWKDQCVNPFVVPDEFAPFIDFAIVSNYALMDQPDGVCLDHLGCIFDNCIMPTTTSPLDTSQFNQFVFSESQDLSFLEEDPESFNLPARVLKPQSASDIVHAVEFCHEHGIGVSVKVAGHSYFGASTGRGLLITMNPTYPKYAIEGSGLVECEVGSGNPRNLSSENPDAWVCALAQARGKKAYLRVGGGELFDEAYRAVSFSWNRDRFQNDPTQGNLYHMVGGGAGTVSAAGGWVASGGLSGTTGMRMYGVGSDQVLQVEMILPNGAHVRFGPTDWEDQEEGMIHPETTQVTGFCNANPYSEEALWEWMPCGDDLDFDFADLWFAVRGGGGGTWGVVTSLYYQLHDYPGALQATSFDLSSPFYAEVDMEDETTMFALTRLWIEFSMRYLYRPMDLGVSKQDSDFCGSAGTASLTPSGLFLCYGSSGTRMTEAWRSFVSTSEKMEFLRGAGFSETAVQNIPDILTATTVADSYADLVVVSEEPAIPDISAPVGRLPDNPPASLVPFFNVFPQYLASSITLFPLDVFQGTEEKFVAIVDLMASEVVSFPDSQTLYAMGGAIPFASDQANALSPTRRNAAFMKSVVSETFRDAYFSIFFDDSDMTGDFPGSSCHNHALLYDMGPRKDDWTKVCPMSWSYATRQERCISFDDAAWGSANVRRLTDVKVSVDPQNLFVCYGGVGSGRAPLPDMGLVDSILNTLGAVVEPLLQFLLNLF